MSATTSNPENLITQREIVDKIGADQTLVSLAMYKLRPVKKDRHTYSYDKREALQRVITECEARRNNFRARMMKYNRIIDKALILMESED